MDVIEVVPGLHLLRLGIANAYLWHDEDGATLVDTGPPGSGPVVTAVLRSLGLRREDVRRVVLTHFHDDHAGSAAAVRAWSGAEVVAHAAEAPIVRGEVPGSFPDLLPAERELLAQVAAGMPPAPPCPVDREVGEGDVLAFGGGAHVLHAPGHTDGSIAVHLPGPRVLFTGDTVAEHAGSALLGPFNLDRRRAADSFRRLVALDVDLALVGHGEPVPGSDLATADLGPFGG